MNEMQVSSFFGCLSLKTGTLLIAILHMVGSTILSVHVGTPHFERGYWSSLWIIQISFGFMLIIGVVRGKPESVFPFLSMHFMTVVVMIYHVVTRLIREFSVMFYTKRETITTLCLFLALCWIYYSFIVVHSFYQELLHKKFRAIFSAEEKVQKNEISNDQSILNNFMQQEAQEKKLNGDVLIQCHEETKKSAN